jgi:glucosamine--fructose-6-phosphate aminotransferase (isomerizing)
VKAATKESLIRKEILEQPEALRRLATEEWPRIERVARAIQKRQPRFLMLVARGSSDNAARYGQYLFGSLNRLPVALATPSLFTLYDSWPRLQDSVVLSISQSGQSPDIVAVMEEGRRQGAMTVAVTNDPDSPLAAAAEHNICLNAGPERSPAATKTYTTSLLALALLSRAMNEARDWLPAVERLPELVADLLRSSEAVSQAAERYRFMEACVVVSRGYNHATAYEIALKLKELTYVLAEPHSSADFRHGPLALVERGFPILVIVPEGFVAEELVDFLKQLRDRGAELLVISAMEEALGYADTPLRLPKDVPEWLSPVVAAIPGQLFTLGLAMAKGVDPDQPRGITKITLTR